MVSLNEKSAGNVPHLNKVKLRVQNIISQPVKQKNHAIHVWLQ